MQEQTPWRPTGGKGLQCIWTDEIRPSIRMHELSLSMPEANVEPEHADLSFSSRSMPILAAAMATTVAHSYCDVRCTG